MFTNREIRGNRSTYLIRRSAALLAAALLATLCLSVSPALAHPTEAGADLDDNAPPIVSPVAGDPSFSDTFGACRGSGCSRSHKGVDMFADRLTPLIAAADGVITHNRQSALTTAGNTVILESDDGWRYLYLHLNNDSPGTDDNSNPQGWILANRLRVGDRVEAGDVIGYLGDSGNAETTPPHLHFEIRPPGRGAINPTPAVHAAVDAGRVVSLDSLGSTAEARAEFEPEVRSWYQELMKRDATETELAAWSNRLATGQGETADLIADLTMAKPRRNPAGAVFRAFSVVLDRRPSLNEHQAWEQRLIESGDPTDMSAFLLESSEFTDKGELDDDAFINLLYRQALDRQPSTSRLEHWREEFAAGAPRSALAAHLADSYPVKNDTWHDLEVTQAFRASLERLPTTDEFEEWTTHLDAGGLIPDVVAAILVDKTEQSDDPASGTPLASEAETDGEPPADNVTETGTDNSQSETDNDGDNDGDPPSTGGQSAAGEDGESNQSPPADATPGEDQVSGNG